MLKTTKYQIMVDPQSFFTKQEALDMTGLVKVRILNYPVEATIDEIMHYIMRGQTVVLGELEVNYEYLQRQKKKKKKPAASKDTWVSQQIFAVDIDNEYIVKDKDTGKKVKVKREGEFYLETEDILHMCQSRGIQPAVIYETLSSKEDHRKYRALFVMDELVTEDDLRERIAMTFIECFYYEGERLSDTKCKDAARLFFGGKEITYQNYEAINSINHLLNIPITYTIPRKTSGPTDERKKNIREQAKQSTNEIVKLIANHEWEKLKRIIADRFEEAISPTATRDGEVFTKLQTFEKIVYRTIYNSYITKDVMSASWLSDFKPVVVRSREDFYHSATVFPMEFLFGFETYENISCILPDHPDHSPSARFEYSQEGKSKYRCYACCESYSLDIFDLFEALSGLSTTSIRHHLAYIFNMSLETKWQKEKREELRDFADVYGYAEQRIQPFAPALYKRLKISNSLLFLEKLMNDVRTYLPDKSITGHEEAVYIAEVRKISSWLRERNVPGSGKDAVQKKLHLAALLGLIEYLPEDSDSVFVSQAKARKRDKALYKSLFHQYRVNIIKVPVFTKQVFLEAERRVNYLDSIGFRWSMTDRRSALIWAMDQEEVSKHYVQDTEKNKKTTEEIKAFERLSAAAEDLLETQGYFTQKDLLGHKRVRQLRKKKELLAIVTPELLKSSEIEYTYYKSNYKDLYQINQGKLKELKPGRTKIYRRIDKEEGK